MKRRKKAKRQRVRAGVGRGGDSYQPYSDTIITEDAPLVNKSEKVSLAHLLIQTAGLIGCCLATSGCRDPVMLKTVAQQRGMGT